MAKIIPSRSAADKAPRYIGLDLAKSETRLALLDADGRQTHSRRFASTRENFEQLASSQDLDCSPRCQTS